MTTLCTNPFIKATQRQAHVVSKLVPQVLTQHARAAKQIPKSRSLLHQAISGLFSVGLLGVSLHAGLAYSISLGEPTLRSFLGEPLDVSLPLMESVLRHLVHVNM